MTTKFYAEIFRHSGASYHKAMQLFPSARDEEFKTALSLLGLQPQDQLLDVPAGGGYLKRYLHPSNQYLGFDFSGGFAPNSDIKSCSETHIPLQNDTADGAICLAALHHVQDKSAFIKELQRCLVPGRRAVIGDVVTNTKEAHFLDGFVNQWNSLGHQGNFIEPDRDLSLLKKSGFEAHFHTTSYHWDFSTQADCHQYIRLLFALDKRPPTAELSAALELLGTSGTQSKFQLNWSLGFLVATKR